jgi:hypothetical protein
MSRVRMDWMIGFNDALHTELGTTGNTSILLFYTLSSSPIHTQTRVLGLRESYPGNGFKQFKQSSNHTLAIQLTLNCQLYDCRLKTPSIPLS